jgi:hypothetical protein
LGGDRERGVRHRAWSLRLSMVTAVSNNVFAYFQIAKRENFKLGVGCQTLERLKQED